MMITNTFVQNIYAHSQKVKKSTDIAFTFAHKYRDISLLNEKEIDQQIASWNRLPKVRCFEYNNRKVSTPDGKEWYVLVIQSYDGDEMEESNPSCPISLFLFNVMVDGYTYAFESERMRDEVYQCVNKRTLRNVEREMTLTEVLHLAGKAAAVAKKLKVDKPINLNEVLRFAGKTTEALNQLKELQNITKSAELKLAEKLEEEPVQKPLSKKDLAKQKAAEARAEAKAEKKRRDDYLKAIGKFKTPDQIKKEKEARLKTEVAMMRK